MRHIYILLLISSSALAQYNMEELRNRDTVFFDASYRLATMMLEMSYEKIPAVKQVYANMFELNDSNMWTDYTAGAPLEYLKQLIPTCIVAPENTLKINPVPATREITFTYTYCETKGATVLIENHKSLQVAKLFFAAKTNNYVLDISNWATGKYFYAVIQNNVQIDKGRFEKIK